MHVTLWRWQCGRFYYFVICNQKPWLGVSRNLTKLKQTKSFYKIHCMIAQHFSLRQSWTLLYIMWKKTENVCWKLWKKLRKLSNINNWISSAIWLSYSWVNHFIGNISCFMLCTVQMCFVNVSKKLKNTHGKFPESFRKFSSLPVTEVAVQNVYQKVGFFSAMQSTITWRTVVPLGLMTVLMQSNI